MKIHEQQESDHKEKVSLWLCLKGSIKPLRRYSHDMQVTEFEHGWVASQLEAPPTEQSLRSPQLNSEQKSSLYMYMFMSVQLNTELANHC